MSVNLVKSALICLELSLMLVFLALFVIILLKRMHRSAPCSLPGPYGLPVLGCVHIFNPPCRAHLKLARLSRAYGPIFQIRLGSERVLVLNSVDSVKEALLAKSCDFIGQPPFHSLLFILGGRAASVFTSRTQEQEGDATRSLRIKRIIEGAMAHASTNTQGFCMRVNITMQQLKSTFLEMEGTAFDPSTFVDQVIADLMFKTVFGEALPRRYVHESQAILRELKSHLPQAIAMLMYLDFVPFARFLYRPQVQQLTSVITVFVEFVRKLCNEHNQLLVQRRDESQSLLYTLRNLHINENYWSFTDENSVFEVMSQDLEEETLICILAETFVVGYHKLSTCIRWGLMLLANNPQIQEDIKKELKHSIGDARLCLQDKAKVPLLESTVLEVLRVCSLIPLALPHCTNKDTTLSGYSIPKGTTVLVNQWACNRDPKCFAYSADFNPYRFLDDTGRKLVNTCSFLTFLTGERKCIADAFSKSVLILIFGSLIKDFKLELSVKSLHSGDHGFIVQPPAYEIKALRRHYPEI